MWANHHCYGDGIATSLEFTPHNPLPSPGERERDCRADSFRNDRFRNFLVNGFTARPTTAPPAIPAVPPPVFWPVPSRRHIPRAGTPASPAGLPHHHHRAGTTLASRRPEAAQHFPDSGSTADPVLNAGRLSGSSNAPTGRSPVSVHTRG